MALILTESQLTALEKAKADKKTPDPPRLIAAKRDFNDRYTEPVCEGPHLARHKQWPTLAHGLA